MRFIKDDAQRVFAEVCMEQNNGDVSQSFKDIKVLDDLLGILKVKYLINHSRGRKSNKEKRFDDVFRARILAASEDRNYNPLNF